MIVWFRQDLRLNDNSALIAAASKGPVIPVFIWCPNEEKEWKAGGASKWWLHHALVDLQNQLAQRHRPLIIRQGDSSLEILNSLLKETGASGVFWNRRYEPAIIERDKKIKAELRRNGFEAESFNSSLLREPHELSTQAGKPFQVYTPFYKAFLKKPTSWEPEELPPLTGPETDAPKSEPIEDLKLLPKVKWDKGLESAWNPTRKGAEALLKSFLEGNLTEYDEARDIPSENGTSRLSPYLHHGQIGPREIWKAVKDSEHHLKQGAETYLKEIVWREFAYHILYHFPSTPTDPLRDKFRSFPWEDNVEHLKAWQRGQTGYPIVDAGMRQLWQTGWMHNRVRMIVGSILVKHLLQPWQEGAKWFWDTLVDADLASNTLGWQWSGGCGADAAPYFRVFNPISQAEKFDPKGQYIHRFVPELTGLSGKDLFAPWEADKNTLKRAGIELGKDYPEPLILPADGRKRALAAFAKIK